MIRAYIDKVEYITHTRKRYVFLDGGDARTARNTHNQYVGRHSLTN